MNRKPQSGIDFWNLKHQIDDEIKRLGWSKEKCKAYVQRLYDKDSRLLMTDEQLLDLYDRLSNLARNQITIRKLRKRLRNKLSKRSR